MVMTGFDNRSEQFKKIIGIKQEVTINITLIKSNEFYLTQDKFRENILNETEET